MITCTLFKNAFDNFTGLSKLVPFFMHQLLDIEHHGNITIGIPPVPSCIPGRSKFIKKTLPVPQQVRRNTDNFTDLTDRVIVFC